jgi:hypothetical protein
LIFCQLVTRRNPFWHRLIPEVVLVLVLVHVHVLVLVFVFVTIASDSRAFFSALGPRSAFFGHSWELLAARVHQAIDNGHPAQAIEGSAKPTEVFALFITRADVWAASLHPSRSRWKCPKDVVSKDGLRAFSAFLENRVIVPRRAISRRYQNLNTQTPPNYIRSF